MKPSASFIFDAKIIWKQYRQFHSVFTWNCGKINNKNKDGFCWNLIFYIKQGNKSRVVNCSLIKYLMHILDIKYERPPPLSKNWKSSMNWIYFSRITKSKTRISTCISKANLQPKLEKREPFLKKSSTNWKSFQFH